MLCSAGTSSLVDRATSWGISTDQPSGDVQLRHLSKIPCSPSGGMPRIRNLETQLQTPRVVQLQLLHLRSAEELVD